MEIFFQDKPSKIQTENLHLIRLRSVGGIDGEKILCSFLGLVLIVVQKNKAVLNGQN
jgi:hypothetical protein